MLYHFLAPLSRSIKLFNLFNYITFRAAGAFVTSLLVAFLVGPAIIARLRAMSVNQVVREGTPETHAKKKNTPTMGGLIILCATLVPTLLWAKLDNRYVLLALIVTACMGLIGFLDDYLKLLQKRRGVKNEGLVEKYKLVGQIAIGLALGFYLWKFPISTLPGASTTLPFFKYVLVVPAAAWLGW
ncbi:MAG TPA: phospho-N-acetylmuramoyl-pentapeptide-transferase, partial [Gemmatimonadaceae bacterium]|nr:phospho-N-acetylmuramoyl-pentapeptide-transferase [Gemmatimonadaceae bacterium]